MLVQGASVFFSSLGIYIVVDTLLLVFPLLYYKAQVKQYHCTDMLLDFVFCRLPTWEPTGKKSQVCDGGNNCIEKDNMTLLDESTDKKATDNDTCGKGCIVGKFPASAANCV